MPAFLENEISGEAQTSNATTTITKAFGFFTRVLPVPDYIYIQISTLKASDDDEIKTRVFNLLLFVRKCNMILLFNSDFDCLWSLPILELPRPFGVMGW